MTVFCASIPMWSKGSEVENALTAIEMEKESSLPDKPSIEAQIQDLWLRVAALSRRVEALEATTFQLVDEEEIILVAVSNA